MEELVARRQRVRMVNRRGQMAETPTGVEVVSGNAYEAANVRALTQGATTVYQCAQPEYTEWPEKFPPLQAAILEGAAANGAKLIICDNLYMYGDTHGQPLREDLPYAATDKKGRTRAQMAEAALAAHQAGKVRVALVRGSDFFGPYATGQSHLGERSVIPALQGKGAQLVGNLDVPHTYTYIKDFSRALVTVGERDDALGQAWHTPNDQPRLTQREIMTLFFQEIGKPARMSGANRLMMQLLGLFVPSVRELVPLMYQFEKPYIVDSSKFERAFGVKATPLREAVRETVAWFRAHPARAH
jgi:nucleoside-diphosphate-sugar epimerase